MFRNNNNHDYICFKGFGWNNVSQRRRRWPSITSAFGPMCRVIWCFWRRDFKGHQPNAAVRKDGPASKTVGQQWNSIGWMTRDLREVYNRPGDRLVLGQRRRRLTGIELVMGCNAGPTLNRNLLVGLHPLYQVHRRQVLNECWPAMVVEVIHFWSMRKTNTLTFCL